MQRRGFLKFASVAGLGGVSQIQQAQAQNAAATQTGIAPDVFIERARPGQPSKGKVFALITPHLDDGPIFAGGTIAKLLNEGYTGYFIRMSDDEKDSYSMTLGQTVMTNEQDTDNFVKVSGMKKWYDLSYRNHAIDDVSRTEMRLRLIFLFRLLKIDTILSYDPWGHYEENPDHYVTAQAVEAACWMSGDHLDYPEHFELGLKPQGVREKYYFARGPQLVNRVVDISSMQQQKIAYMRACRNMMDNMVKSAKAELAATGYKLPAFEGSEDAANAAYIEMNFTARDKAVGARHGLEYAEEFHYIGPDANEMQRYIAAGAMRI